MLHNRVWAVVPADSAESLAEKLTEFTWCGCTGFAIGGYLFVNDSTSADGAQEYGVMRWQDEEDRYAQIESLTFSWMDQSKAMEIIHRVLAGEFDAKLYGLVEAFRIQTPQEHGRCQLCM